MIVVCPPHPDEIQEVSRNIGDTLSLLCKNTAGKVTWLKNENLLPDDCKENKRNARCFTHKQRLTFRTITKADAGKYKCQANNQESPLFGVKVSDDHISPSWSPPTNTYKPTASSGSLTNAQGTNRPSKPVQPTRIVDFSQPPSPPNSTTRPAELSTQSSRSSATTASLFTTSKRGAYDV